MESSTFISVLEIVNTFAELFLCITVITAIIQLFTMKKTLFEDHERSRRERAIDLILEWVKFTRNGTGAKCIVERLDENQCEKVWKELPFEMDKRFKEYAERNIKDFGAISLDQSGRLIQVSSLQSSILRKEVVAYLNLTEVIFAAMYNGIADKAIISNEFNSLVCDRQNLHYLEKFRKIAGAKSAYPYSYMYVEECEKRVFEKQPLGM